MQQMYQGPFDVSICRTITSAGMMTIHQSFASISINRFQSITFYGLFAVNADEALQTRAKPLAASEGKVDRHSILRTVEGPLSPAARRLRPVVKAVPSMAWL